MNKETLIKLFTYLDGSLYWRNGNGRNVKSGDRRGSTSCGYRVVRVNRVLYMEHRLIFLYHYGYIPETIDHIDRDKSNNRIDNLRLANKSINKHNCNSIGRIPYRGITLSGIGRFVARIKYNGKREYLGIFDTPLEASVVYEKAAKKYYG